MARILLSLLARAARAKSDKDFVEALLQAWSHVVEADYHSLVRRSEASGHVEFWHPGEGRLEPEHRLMKSFARLWAMEQPMATHPSVAAFLKNGPGAYLRSEWEPDSVWRRRAHYRLVDKPQGIADMVTVFLTPSNGTLVMLNAGSRGPEFPQATLRLAKEFAVLANAMLVARGGFADKPAVPPVEMLTAREVEILHWVDEGKRNIEIGSILGVSAFTIRAHIGKILAKLGVETRTAAVTALKAKMGKGKDG
jgi:DNA-binding CsgD family transcriptional regulator